MYLRQAIHRTARAGLAASAISSTARNANASDHQAHNSARARLKEPGSGLGRSPRRPPPRQPARAIHETACRRLLLARVPPARGDLTAPQRIEDAQHLVDAAACRQIVPSHKPDDAVGVNEMKATRSGTPFFLVSDLHALGVSGLTSARPGTLAWAVPGAACAAPGGRGVCPQSRPAPARPAPRRRAGVVSPRSRRELAAVDRSVLRTHLRHRYTGTWAPDLAVPDSGGSGSHPTPRVPSPSDAHSHRRLCADAR